MLGERMKRDNMVGCNDKIVLENKLNVSDVRFLNVENSNV
jgi:hypothetical protein